MSRRNLRLLDVPLTGGFRSSANPAIPGHSFTFDNWTWTRSKANATRSHAPRRALQPINGTTQKNVTEATGLRSFHQFRRIDVDGVTKRSDLSLLASGQLRAADADLVASTLKASSMEPEPLCDLVLSDKIYLGSKLNDPVKYDGSSVTKWGVFAPAKNPTEQVAFDSTSGWTGSFANLSAEATIRLRGAASLKIDKTVGSLVAYAENSTLALNLSGGSGYAYLSVCIPQTMFDALIGSISGSFTIRVELGDATFANTGRWSFYKGDLVPGWNTLELALASPTTTVGAGPTLAAIAGMRVMFATTASGSTGPIYADFFYTTESGTVTTGLGGAGLLTANALTYRVTYVTKSGVESNAGPISGPVSPAAQIVSLTNVPVSPDPQVIARRIYRDLDGDEQFRLVGEIADNSTTTFSDNNDTPSATSPPYEGDALFDSSPPERFIAFRFWQGRVFGISAQHPDELWVSDVTSCEVFPVLSRLRVGEALVALEEHASGLLLFSSDRTYLLEGDGVRTAFRLTVVNPTVGANSWRSVCQYKGGVIVWHEDKVYYLGSPADPWLLNADVEREGNVFLAGSGGVENVVAYDPSAGRLWCLRLGAYPQGIVGMYYDIGGTDEPLVSGDGAGVDPQDIRKGRWARFRHDLNGVLSIRDARMVSLSSEIPTLALALSDGAVVYFDDAKTTFAHAGGTASVAASFSIFVPLGRTGEDRAEIRFASIEHTAVANPASDPTLTIQLYDHAWELPQQTDVVTLGSTTLTFDTLGAQTLPVNTNGRGRWARLLFAITNPPAGYSLRSLNLGVIPRFGVADTAAASPYGI